MEYNLFSIHSRVIFASLVSASIHAASLYSYALLTPTSAPEEVVINDNIKISFSLLPPASSKPVLEKITPPIENIETPIPVNKQEAPIKRIINNEIVKTSVPKADKKPRKKHQNKEIKKKPETPLKEDKKPAETTVKKQLEQAPVQSIASLQSPIIIVEEKVSIQEIEDLYIQALLEKIEQNKFYPKKARRRNIQGTVQVEMKLDQSGKIVSLQLSEGHKILRGAAHKAIRQAVPFNAPPASLLTSPSIKFGIHYQFR